MARGVSGEADVRAVRAAHRAAGVRAGDPRQQRPGMERLRLPGVRAALSTAAGPVRGDGRRPRPTNGDGPMRAGEQPEDGKSRMTMRVYRMSRDSATTEERPEVRMMPGD